MSVRIINADVMEGLAQLPDESVHCVVTSPPYWGLRSYLREGHPLKALEIGSEPTLGEHIEKLVTVFREVRRVLRSDGICWLNYGDAYAGSWGAQSRGEHPGERSKLSGGQIYAAPKGTHTGSIKRTPGLKPKDLMLVPFRLAIALQDDGWYVRSRLPWLKPNGMPSSVEDRPGTSVEEVFMLTKSPTYFYDGEAIKLQAKYPAGPNASDKIKHPYGQGIARKNMTDGRAVPPGAPLHKGLDKVGKNERWDNGTSDGQRSYRQSDLFFSALGDVRGVIANGRGAIIALHVATQPYPAAHFATFPPRLIKPLILAGTSAKGCCSKCGAPWERILDRTFVPQPDVSRERGVRGGAGQKSLDQSDGRDGFPRGTTATRTRGWRPTCACEGASVEPCTVLDPFMGAGTTALVADRLQRNAIGFELSDEYAGQAQERITSDRPGGPGGLLDLMEGQG